MMLHDGLGVCVGDGQTEAERVWNDFFSYRRSGLWNKSLKKSRTFCNESPMYGPCFGSEDIRDEIHALHKSP